MEAYLGIDVGSVTTKFAVMSKDGELVGQLYPLMLYSRGWRKFKSNAIVILRFVALPLLVVLAI